MVTQTQMALGLLQQFVNRGLRKEQKALVQAQMRRIRIRVAEEEWQEMERHGKKLPSMVDFDHLPF